MSNAIKFTPIKGQIQIRVSSDQNHAQISIEDSGIGMPEGILKSLFVSEINTSRSGTNGEHGTGLGLVLCKEFVKKKNKGGELKVSSIENKGSKFTFTLPLAKKTKINFLTGSFPARSDILSWVFLRNNLFPFCSLGTTA